MTVAKEKIESKLLEFAQYIHNYELRQMVIDLLNQYMPKLKTYPASFSGYHHFGETIEEHIIKTVAFAALHIQEFNLNQDDADVLYASAILHDIANAEFISEERDPNQNQRLHQGKYNRSSEAAHYHAVLSMFMIGKYMLEKKLLNPLIMKTALAVSAHMNHWYAEYSPEPRNNVERFLAMSDYLASKKEVKLNG